MVSYYIQYADTQTFIIKMYVIVIIMFINSSINGQFLFYFAKIYCVLPAKEIMINFYNVITNCAL